jgi:hypothetical protein
LHWLHPDSVAVAHMGDHPRPPPRHIHATTRPHDEVFETQDKVKAV